jgi:hypothetical protein
MATTGCRISEHKDTCFLLIEGRNLLFRRVAQFAIITVVAWENDLIN